MPPRHKLSNLDRGFALAWLNDGVSMREVARRLHVSYSVIQRLQERFRVVSLANRLGNPAPEARAAPADRMIISCASPHCAIDRSPPLPRSGELRTQKLKYQLVRTQSLNVLPLKPGVGQYIPIHATLTARNFFLVYFYPSDPFTYIFSKTFRDFFPALAVANTGSCVGSQNKTSHLAGCRFSC